MTDTQASIVNLDSLVAGLSGENRGRFERLFRVTTTNGQLIPPASMEPWINKQFGSVAVVRDQKIVKVTNLVTFEESLFNELRAKRPIEAKEATGLKQIIDESLNDPFCRPLEGTPEDVFGRVTGEHCVTASNIAKYDGFHGVVIFQNHDPLQFNEGDVIDYVNTSYAWVQAAHQSDPIAIYPFIMWNCLWKSGASIVHGHFQVTLGRGSHYGKIENLRQMARAYRERFGSDYFADLWATHDNLRLALEWRGIKGLAYLTPLKEKETILIGSALDDSMKAAIFRVANCFVRDLGVTSFNLAVYLPPLAAAGEDWSGFPVMVRMVDRGDPQNKTADIGAMELYAASVISSDPFRVADALRQCFA